MCYATKRKIADCIKRLMRRKEIARITIGDVMEETKMSRQSFYYHFHDIYDVMEWIAVNDFQIPLSGKEYDSLEVWALDVLRVLDKEHYFFEKMVDEMPWPGIVGYMKKPVEEQLEKFFAGGNAVLIQSEPEQWKKCMDFFATSFCYYLLDEVSHRRKLSEQKTVSQLYFSVRMLQGFSGALQQAESKYFEEVPAKEALMTARHRGGGTAAAAIPKMAAATIATV